MLTDAKSGLNVHLRADFKFPETSAPPAFRLFLGIAPLKWVLSFEYNTLIQLEKLLQLLISLCSTGRSSTAWCTLSTVGINTFLPPWLFPAVLINCGIHFLP